MEPCLTAGHLLFILTGSHNVLQMTAAIASPTAHKPHLQAPPKSAGVSSAHPLRQVATGRQGVIRNCCL